MASSMEASTTRKRTASPGVSTAQKPKEDTLSSNKLGDQKPAECAKDDSHGQQELQKQPTWSGSYWPILLAPVVIAIIRAVVASADEAASVAKGSSALVMATMTALSLSCDDVVWFMAFMTGKNKRRNAFVYLVMMEFNVVFASALQWLSVVVGKALDVGLSRWLQVASAVAISVYTVKLFFEWRAEQAGQGQDEADDEAPSSGRSVRDLAVIAFMGSLDNFAVFLSLLLSGTLTAPQLFGGVFFQSIIVVSICGGLGSVASVARFVDKIPLFMIIGALALWVDAALFFL